MSPTKRLLTIPLQRLLMGAPIVGRRIVVAPVLHLQPPFRVALPQSSLSGRYSTTASTTAAQSPSTKLYDYEAVKSLTKTNPPKTTLIDVREPAEFDAGAIPTAVNIPITSSPDALALSPEEFEDRFGFAKPGLEEEVVFYCKAGIRCATAAQLAVGVGYRRVGEYRGSWIDWERKEKGV
ncbi:unnamed protein product [Tuber aestivum]|uniref:Rhodanese domain-containing protein n=1 Tax=Tuber aestivum TaxID=59557 RepID=A0A292PSB8_9PEZI|nr:unnamed protein product [Tuber aestivum]